MSRVRAQGRRRFPAKRKRRMERSDRSQPGFPKTAMRFMRDDASGRAPAMSRPFGNVIVVDQHKLGISAVAHDLKERIYAGGKLQLRGGHSRSFQANSQSPPFGIYLRFLARAFSRLSLRSLSKMLISSGHPDPFAE